MTKARTPNVIVRIADSPRDAWEGVLREWFERVRARSWKSSRPSLVVVPTRSHASALKGSLIEEGRSHLGIHFVTPAGLRELLAHDESRPRPAPEHLRLLLAIAAEASADGPNDLTAKAVVRAPAHLLRTLDRLKTAGWDFKELQMPSFEPIVRRFSDLLQACGFDLPSEIDRQRWKEAREENPRFSNVLVCGFDGAHWAWWFLLRTAVEVAENATVLLEEPRGDLSEIDLCWIGSWEEAYAEALPGFKPAADVRDSLFTETEMRGAVRSSPRFTFLAGANASEQADAITLQCVRFLSEPTCTRLGIIFPGAGSLPRLVARALAGLEIPHNDGIAHIVPGLFESAEWQAWLALQRSPRTSTFLRFLNALNEPAVLSPGMSSQEFERILRDSYGEILLDDLDILREFCASRPGDANQMVAAALRSFSLLPPRATLAQFLEKTEAALQRLGWEQHSTEIANRSRDWPDRIAVEFPRALYLRWLEETAATFGASRSAAGDHPYARVQLLTVPHAQGEEWSHLIFAGWNESAWPPPASAEFARDEEIRSFNRRVQQLNRRATRPGRQGEGHTSVRENHSLYLGPHEQRQIALRQFDALLESAAQGVALSASLAPENAPERVWNPSECFTRLYQQTHRRPLTQAAFVGLQRATARWLEQARALTRKPEATPPPEVKKTLTAFTARRNPDTPAGEYDFALRSLSDYHPVPALSVSDLEGMVSSPAIIWLKRYLGVEGLEEAANPWNASTGKWVHRWLASIAGHDEGKTFVRFPSPSEIDERIRAAADAQCTTLTQLCVSVGKSVPDWWRSGWLNARYLARHLGSKLATAKGWNWMAMEFRVGRDGVVVIAEDVALLLRGQIDLVLAQNEPARGNLADEKLWIIDYKTGSTPALKSSDLHDSLVKGTTLQLGLYSLAIRARGAGEVGASLISAAVKTVAPQLTVDELAAHTNVFADLATMQQSGVFGMKGEIRPAWGYTSPYPLATLQVDLDVLEDKWARTHEALVLEKEEWESW